VATVTRSESPAGQSQCDVVSWRQEGDRFGTRDGANVRLRRAVGRRPCASGDDAIGAMLEVVSESLCDLVDLHAGARVLDVAAGTATCSLAAARRRCEVTSIDEAPAGLEHGRRRAAADRLTIRFQQAHAEALPFAARVFDVVLSMFGVMFAPNHVRAASELVRVCRPFGRIGLANWTPQGFMGRMLTVVSDHAPRPPGLTPATLWGLDDHLDRLFYGSAWDLHANRRDFVLRYRSAEHCLHMIRTCNGPVGKAFTGLSADKQRRLEQDMFSLIDDFNISTNSTVVIPSEYVEVVVVKK